MGGVFMTAATEKQLPAVVAADAGSNSDETFNRCNNFGAVRLVLAVLVLYSHSFPLSGQSADPLAIASRGLLNFGSVAVDGFFLISGCLVAESWARSNSPARFLNRRLARLYPGYWGAMAFSIVVGTLGSAPNSREYLLQLCYDHDFGLRNLLFFEYGWLDRSMAFAGNPYPSAVNGSLWTLRWELACYLITLVAGITGFFASSRRQAFCVASLYVVWTVFWLQCFELEKWFLRLLMFYLAGTAVASIDKNAFRLTLPRLAFWCSLVFLAMCSATGTALCYPPLWTYAIFAVSRARLAPFHGWFARHDLSYGIYLYAFPLQQCAARYFCQPTALKVFAAALPATMLCAAASWVLIERPAIRRGSRMGKSDPRNGENAA
jgi:peptidoglycan/LPS O-acetylase OafA/YrhL